jgi:hypothetical protein
MNDVLTRWNKWIQTIKDTPYTIHIEAGSAENAGAIFSHPHVDQSGT